MYNTQQLLEIIIDHATNSDPLPFTYIKTWAEYLYCKKKSKAFKGLLKVLEKGSNNLLKRYCKAVRKGDANITTLIASRNLLDVRAFYEKEIFTLDDMCEEYRAYLLDGNLIRSIFGEKRIYRDLRDFRKSEDT